MSIYFERVAIKRVCLKTVGYPHNMHQKPKHLHVQNRLPSKGLLVVSALDYHLSQHLEDQSIYACGHCQPINIHFFLHDTSLGSFYYTNYICLLVGFLMSLKPPQKKNKTKEQVAKSKANIFIHLAGLPEGIPCEFQG